MWTRDPAWTLKAVPGELRGGILVDSSAAPVTPSGFLKRALAREESEYLDKFASAEAMPALAILPRSDLRVFLCIEEREPAAPAPPNETSAPGLVELSDGVATAACRILEITGYTVMPLSRITGRYFFIVVAPYL